MKTIAIIGASNDRRKFGNKSVRAFRRQELWLNPGTESEEVLTEAHRLGLNLIQACSIVGVGVSPEELN